MTKNIIIYCPTCNIPIIIQKLNCKIFRHGVIKSTNKQINPHATEVECNYYIKNDLIYGCGKPFTIDNNNSAIVCKYI
jgi:hypothetical protein